MGIVIFAPYRGKGYAVPALKLLLDHAFRVCGISRLHNDFETTRDVAWAIHRKVGFKEMGVENGLLQLMLTKEDYLDNNP
jgi:RimJ/RimL family protein N-acetyltransferase